jgi:hypothetical protein
MHPDVIMLALRNIFLVQLLMGLTFAVNSPRLQQELVRIWKTLNAPLLRKKPVKPNHKSGKFWEIDMTDFEP